MKIKAFAHLNDKVVQCSGEIQIHWIKENQAYVSWKIESQESLIASKYENIFLHKNGDGDAVQIIIERIQTYRIGRKKIFFDVTML